jgi:hypothetical protein
MPPMPSRGLTRSDNGEARTYVICGGDQEITRHPVGKARER